ncbi:ATP-binding protein [Aliarcobacter cryaerophilus]|uniref:ATP-binding protein n=1 Tax=Aliarcobacter cryaerophilus TaxID=28198 RepID=UPI0021B43D6A|nr:ATP-binding protein [Aliarcobacter cryaerophilus]MCT7488193.1 ATP-binding protein [Aliarcobacter cryaerophilus]MCT7504897.1 ATP-binding protein [Aliarcobacter cryaerophilus]
MELVYLWVEKYKNIENQGFNFSPRFNCIYDENKNELTINENKDYISIFPNNINITAIVGENGSGKSSILEILLLFFLKSNSGNKSNEDIWIIVYNKEKKIFYINYFPLKKSFNDIKIPSNFSQDTNIYYNKNDNKKYLYYVNIKDKKIFNLHFNPSFELPSTIFESYIEKNNFILLYNIDFKPYNIANILSFPSKHKGQINIKRNENINLLNMFKVKNIINNNIEEILKQVFNDKLVFIPKEIDLHINEDIGIALNNDLKDIYKKISLNLHGLYTFFFMSIISTCNFPTSEDEEFRDYFTKDETYLKKYLFKKYKEAKENTGKNTEDIRKNMAENIYRNIEEFFNVSKEIKIFDELLEHSEKFIKDVSETAKMIDKINETKLKDLEKDNKNLLYTNINDIKDKSSLLELLPFYISADTTDINNIKFSDFSLGEKNIINFVYSFLYYINYYEAEIYNLILDEIEIGFNPKWQKNLLDIILKLLKIEVFKDKKFIVNISTHSPFILSDIPKENIIFLEKGKQVYPFEDGKQTFGANIHTLLSHGFFMKDGFMGEFAKNEINSIILYHKEIEKKELTKEENKKQIGVEKEKYTKEYKTKFWKIQSIIGDDYLKQVVKNHLVEIEKIVLGNDEAKRLEIERLEEQIKELKK